MNGLSDQNSAIQTDRRLVFTCIVKGAVGWQVDRVALTMILMNLAGFN